MVVPTEMVMKFPMLGVVFYTLERLGAGESG